MATEKLLKDCTAALERIQQFASKTLSREDVLGTEMGFKAALPLAESIVAIYRRLSVSSLADFSDTQLNTIMNQANADFNSFKEILDFTATVNDANGVRNRILTNLERRRDTLFDQVWQFVAYGVARNTDTSRLETEARATIQSIQDQSAKLTTQLGEAKTNADAVLAEIRAVASEQGVQQQAIYFKNEANDQETLAETWLKFTYWFASAVGLFAVLSLGLHKIEWIKPENTSEMFQLVTSKILIFSVLGYLLVMAARNYASHRHNAVVNRHRQNALLTYRALVHASADSGTEDIVLAHAAACIFSPQETGFSHAAGAAASGSKSVLELLTKGASKSEG